MTATAVRAQKASAPAITQKIIHAEDISKAIKWNGIVYGFSGAGKTTLLATASDAGEKVLVIDVEAGSSGLSDRKNTDIVVPSGWDELGELYQFLAESEHEYTFVVIDSLTEVGRMSLERVVRDGKTPDNIPTLQQYGQSNEQVIRLVRAFRSLATSGKIGLGLTALAKEEKDENLGTVLVRPTLSPGVQGQVLAAVDVVGYLAQGVTKEGSQRVLSLTNTGRSLGKFRVASSVVIPPQLFNPTMVDLFALQAAGVK